MPPGGTPFFFANVPRPKLYYLTRECGQSSKRERNGHSPLNPQLELNGEATPTHLLLPLPIPLFPDEDYQGTGYVVLLKRCQFGRDKQALGLQS